MLALTSGFLVSLIISLTSNLAWKLYTKVRADLQSRLQFLLGNNFGAGSLDFYDGSKLYLFPNFKPFPK